jgi:hypothetical protein
MSNDPFKRSRFNHKGRPTLESQLRELLKGRTGDVVVCGPDSWLVLCAEMDIDPDKELVIDGCQIMADPYVPEGVWMLRLPDQADPNEEVFVAEDI